MMRTFSLMVFLATTFSTHGHRELPAPESDFVLSCPHCIGNVEFTYLNVGTLGPSPKCVMDEVYSKMLQLETNPNFEYYANYYLGGQAARMTAGKFMHCSYKDVLLMPSTTVSMNLLGQGLVDSGFLKTGDRVLTSNQEHAGAINIFQHHVNVTGIQMDSAILPIQNMTKQTVLDVFKLTLDDANDDPYKVVMFSHVLTTTGFLMPVKEISALIKVHNPSAMILIDGAQAPGGIDVNFDDLDVDAYATSSHKWQLSPKGSALLIIKDGSKQFFKDSYLDGGFGDDVSEYSGSFGIKTSSTGTLPSHTIAGQRKSMEYLMDFGMKNVEAYNVGLRMRFQEGLLKLGLPVLGALTASDSSPMITFGLPDDKEASKMANKLWLKHGFYVKITGRGAYPNEWPSDAPLNALRVSFHVYNTEAQCDNLLSVLASVLNDHDDE